MITIIGGQHQFSIVHFEIFSWHYYQWIRFTESFTENFVSPQRNSSITWKCQLLSVLNKSIEKIKFPKNWEVSPADVICFITNFQVIHNTSSKEYPPTARSALMLLQTFIRPLPNSDCGKKRKSVEKYFRTLENCKQSSIKLSKVLLYSISYICRKYYLTCCLK